MSHGITYDLHQKRGLEQERKFPTDIAAGLDDVSKRGGWNKPAPTDYALPTETWREHVARRQRYEEIHKKILAGEITSINDLVTYNLDIEKFAQDVITQSEGPELVRAFWKAINKISVLDPACGSGAFLFAALNILETLCVTCLEAMQGFLDDLERSGRKHHPETLSDFRKVVRRVEEHASERYFILKSIIISNLYGVDIMEEAVEICKLRLFLKLVAQLENYDQIEPLPDIDFNIRAGNTLVGFASLDQVKKALGADMVKNLALPDIEERAAIADMAFRQFREMQTVHGMDAENFAAAKAKLRDRLNDLRAELDRYLADEYGIKMDEPEAYDQWRDRYQPFHWFVEFYGIMHGGGFDVLIGNPPYLETREVNYLPHGFRCEDSGAIHAMFIEQGLNLNAFGGYTSMIVPLALVSTQRMTIVQNLLEADRDCWYANFSWRPGKLFDTVNRALTIFVTTRPANGGRTFSTGYLKWNSGSRNVLIPSLVYADCPRDRDAFWAPKIGHSQDLSILRKCSEIKETLGIFSSRSNNFVYYRTTGGLYWKVFTDFAPKFYVNGVAGSSSRETKFSLAKKEHVTAAIAVLSSDVFWWWYTITSNLRDLNPSDWKNFPVPKSAMYDPEIQKLGAEYIADLERNSTMLIRIQKSTGKTATQSFKVQKSKPIIDQIDKALAQHYHFSDEETDFIINYDIKYRVGLGEQNKEEAA